MVSCQLPSMDTIERPWWDSSSVINTSIGDLIQTSIKDRSPLHILVGNYTNKQCIGSIELSIDHMLQMSINSLITQNMLDEHIQPDTLTPPLHTLLGDVRKLLNQLLQTFKSQFAHDETSIGTIHLTKMQIDMAD